MSQTCDCLKKIANETSKRYANHGVDACVQVSIGGEVRIRKFVMAEDRPGAKELRRSKHGMHESVKFNFCPVCGKPNDSYQHAQVWHDAPLGEAADQ